MSNDTTPVSHTPPQKSVSDRPSAGRGLALCALAALLVLGSGGIWIARVFTPFEARVEDALASSDRVYTGLGGELRGLHAALTSAQASQDARGDQLAALASEVAGITAQLSAPVTPTADLLRLARIEHLVKIADVSLRLARDRARAEAALVMAQAELNTGVPLEAALHQTLRAEQAAIAAVVEPDVGALSAQWAETALQVESLPRRMGAATAPETARDPASPPAGWRGVAGALWQDLLNLVEIRSTTVADQALLDPAREALINARLQIEIATLRGALERRDTRAMRAGAAAVNQALENDFKVNDAEVSALQVALRQLASLELAPALPTVAASLRGIDRLEQANVGSAPASAAENESEADLPEPSAPAIELPALAPREFM